MQEVVDEVIKWTSNNEMEVNSKKTKDISKDNMHPWYGEASNT
jgi:hypothetical protein